MDPKQAPQYGPKSGTHFQPNNNANVHQRIQKHEKRYTKNGTFLRRCAKRGAGKRSHIKIPLTHAAPKRGPKYGPPFSATVKFIGCRFLHAGVQRRAHGPFLGTAFRYQKRDQNAVPVSGPQRGPQKRVSPRAPELLADAISVVFFRPDSGPLIGTASATDFAHHNEDPKMQKINLPATLHKTHHTPTCVHKDAH